MKSIPFILALMVEAKSRKCGDYQFYRDDAKNFIKQCSKRERLPFNDNKTVIDASKFHGDEFNVFFSRLRKFEVCIRVQNTKLKRIVFPSIREAANARCPNACKTDSFIFILSQAQ
ncbi:hypothetical protein GCK32_013611 [Trichostrongylus colubriformis]|uniref:Uncharacterized protein n=1 Tax=Trichostrongylus colubriformis TaxID=6319 RepID=A0AAN8IU05_TRICO